MDWLGKRFRSLNCLESLGGVHQDEGEVAPPPTVLAGLGVHLLFQDFGVGTGNFLARVLGISNLNSCFSGSAKASG
eukprot:647120-Amphidinium_carterae.1